MAIKFRRIEDLEEGNILAQSIRTETNSILLAENTILTEHLIDRLKDLKYSGLTIKDSIDEELSDTGFIDQAVASQIIKNLDNLNAEKILDSAKEIVQSAAGVKEIVLDNHGIWKKDEQFYQEQIAITEFCVLVGKILYFNEKELIDLAVASLWHNMGKLCTQSKNFQKIKIPRLFKERAINKEEFDDAMKTYNKDYYPLYSFGLIADEISISSISKVAIALHRENISRSYEKGRIISDTKNILNLNVKPTEKSYIYSRIIHIMDSFENIINYKIDGRYLTTDEALEYIYIVDNSVDAYIVHAVREALKPKNIPTKSM